MRPEYARAGPRPSRRAKYPLEVLPSERGHARPCHGTMESDEAGELSDRIQMAVMSENPITILG